MKRYLPFLLIAGVFALAFGIGAWLYKTAQPAPSSSATTNTKSAPAPGSDPAHAHGPKDAPVVVEEFGDFQCPPCGVLHPELKKIERQYEGRLRFVFREYPLSMHKYAYDAARAAEAAGMQGKFWEMHDLLYEKQAEWSVSLDPRAMFVEYARTLDMNADRFASDMIGEFAGGRVSLDMRRGESLGVRGTPTVFINGQQLSATDTNPDAIRKAIETALQEKK